MYVHTIIAMYVRTYGYSVYVSMFKLINTYVCLSLLSTLGNKYCMYNICTYIIYINIHIISTYNAYIPHGILLFFNEHSVIMILSHQLPG